MSEQIPVEDEIIIRDRKPEESGARWLDIVGGVLGLVVFVIGIVLIYQVFTKATDLYDSIAPAIQAAQAGSSEAGPVTVEAGGSEADDPEVASPGGPSITNVLLEFALKSAWLLLIAFVGCLIAGMGAKLAGAHRGKRT
ncbi:MAG TPA: hypothetical protein QGH10_12695 [Armatimonadota bacterium]|nr:hypothetical protein [Armatimonadota bacterium]